MHFVRLRAEAALSGETPPLQLAWRAASPLAGGATVPQRAVDYELLALSKRDPLIHFDVLEYSLPTLRPLDG